MSENIIEVKDLKVYFDLHQGFFQGLRSRETPKVKAVDGVSFDIRAGEILSLVGESGSGKTTTGKALLQLVPQTAGEMFFSGDRIEPKNKKWMRRFRQNAQMIYQDPYQSINPKDLIVDIVAEPLIVNKLIGSNENKIEKVIEALESAGLKPAEDYLYRYPHELSGGQRQRVAIACALVMNPGFIVADEPVSMLDVSIRADILKVIGSLRDDKGISYLFITHDLSLAWLISDRVAIMYLGKIVELGAADIISKGCLHPYSQALVSVMPIPKKPKGQKRTILKGETPNPIDLPSGCRFHPRCPIAEAKCREVAPELRQVRPGHFVACHLVN